MFLQDVAVVDSTHFNFNVCNFSSDNYKYFLSEPGEDTAFRIEDEKSGQVFVLLAKNDISRKGKSSYLAYNTCDNIKLSIEKIPATLTTLL